MPVQWDDAREKRLLLEVIQISNPTIERSAWEVVAAVMGGEFTAEACRQKFQGLKRTLKGPSNGAGPPTPSTPKTAKTPKPKTPAAASATGTKGRKRKAADANIHAAADDDDEESTLFAPKAQKLKKETNGKAVGDEIDAEVFKAEEKGEAVDLERDDLYDDTV